MAVSILQMFLLINFQCFELENVVFDCHLLSVLHSDKRTEAAVSYFSFYTSIFPCGSKTREARKYTLYDCAGKLSLLLTYGGKMV